MPNETFAAVLSYDFGEDFDLERRKEGIYG
jgi:hypothetical protein